MKTDRGRGRGRGALTSTMHATKPTECRRGEPFKLAPARPRRAGAAWLTVGWGWTWVLGATFGTRLDSDGPYWTVLVRYLGSNGGPFACRLGSRPMLAGVAGRVGSRLHLSAILGRDSRSALRGMGGPDHPPPHTHTTSYPPHAPPPRLTPLRRYPTGALLPLREHHDRVRLLLLLPLHLLAHGRGVRVGNRFGW
jgi:hypothetical protein